MTLDERAKQMLETALDKLTLSSFTEFPEEDCKKVIDIFVENLKYVYREGARSQF